MGNEFRTCPRCFALYPFGGWRDHLATHPTQLDIVRRLMAEGLSQAEVARRLGVSRQRVHAILREAA